MKRAFDVAGSLGGLILLAPLLVLTAAAVWLEDRRSPWFWGTRGGRGGGSFRMLKFRTMVPDAWSSGVNSTADGDRRITRAGRLLRAVKFDELPQLWNVLRGDMSLVGPRPQVVPDAALYTSVERRMLEVRPGITDLASIVFADEGRILAGSVIPDLLYNQVIRPWKSRLSLALDRKRGNLAYDLATLLLTVINTLRRARALAGIVRILEVWGAGTDMLRQAARRSGPLVPWPSARSFGDRVRLSQRLDPALFPRCATRSRPERPRRSYRQAG